MRRFKVGDKVRVREWDDMAKEFGSNKEVIFCTCFFMDCMKPLCGKAFTVIEERIAGCYGLDGKASGWAFSDDMLYPAITYREYMKENFPDDVEDSYLGGVYGCPHDKGDFFDFSKIGQCGSNWVRCAECWDQYMTEAEYKKYVLKEEDKEEMELKVGQKVRVRRYDQRPNRWNSDGKMDKYMGKVVTIRAIDDVGVEIEEDKNENYNCGWSWRAEDFIPVKFTKSDLKDGMMLETANGERYLWLYGERRAISHWASDLPEKFEDEAKEYPQYEVVKVGYPDTRKGETLEAILRNGEFKEVLWDKEWNKEAVKEITAEEAAKLLKEKFPEYDSVRITV